MKTVNITNTPVIEHRHAHSHFPEHFIVEGKFLINESRLNIYRPHQIEILSYFRLNEKKRPEENGIVYLIEAFDGKNGILIYRFDVFTDCKVYNFLKEYVDYKDSQTQIHSIRMEG